MDPAYSESITDGACGPMLVSPPRNKNTLEAAADTSNLCIDIELRVAELAGLAALRLLCSRRPEDIRDS